MSTANIIGNAIFGLRNKSGGNYINPAVNESLVGLWKFDQNTNESPTRNIIKNTIKDKGGDLELLNFAYKANSGYGGFAVDFTSWSRLIGIKVFSNKFIIKNKAFNCAYYVKDKEKDLDEFKAKITNHTDGIIRYGYINQNGVITYLDITPDNSNRVITFPKSYNSIKGLPNHICGFQTPMFVNTGITIEQLPLYEGALVTDGKDDMIVSQKSFIDIVGSNNQPYTIVSMISFIDNLHTYFNSAVGTSYMTINNIADSAKGKTGIFGYSATNINNTPTSIINNILGDKNDYTTRSETAANLIGREFSIQGYLRDGIPTNVSSVAVYWTFISNKVLTTDEINQIIAYFKLDKYVTPQVIYDVKRQGLTNDTPAADWYLKDFSGNGHDMQLYNYLQAENSGIGKYGTDYTKWSKLAGTIITKDKIVVTKDFVSQYWLCFMYSNVPAYKVRVTGLPEGCTLRYQQQILVNGINELPALEGITSAVGFTVGNTGNVFDLSNLVIEQIPDYEGALVSDGKDDYGKAEGLPILKDYTVAADYARLAKNISSIGDSPILSKSMAAGNGAFIMNSIDNSGITACYSFGTGNSITLEDIQRKIYYQSKYSNQGKGINAGSAEDGTSMWLDTIRDNDTRFIESAFYSMLLFPYSLSEFLLERQLKKYKLGTLYPGMIEWRPKVNINVPVVTPPTFSINNGSDIITNGQYIPEGTEITIRIFTPTDSSVGGINEATAKINGVDIELSPSGNKTYYGGKFIVSSKQKIAITIDEYIRYEDIVQPYPAIINLKQDGKTITWGDKLKVGSDIVFVGSANLLPELYTVSDTRYNGVTLYPNTIIKVEKSMVFDNARTYLKANEPSCILSPNRLRIPNSSYKILGYIPDLTGKGNRGKLNNFAYTEDSGVSVDGSIKFDSTDDHITIPNIIGGKCVMAKVKINSINGVIYDQRRANVLNKSWVQLNPNQIAFEQNAVSTYIDGVLNHNITCSNLQLKTVNITCELEIGDTSGTYQPTIGSTYAVGYTTNINLYEFMLFPDVPDEEEIKELNEVMGIEEDLFLIHLENDDTEIINDTLILNK